MRVSTKGRYALRIMVDLAQHDEGGYIRLKDVAKRQNLTVKYMEQIMPLLTRVGYVKSYRGNNGGYRLAHEPEWYKVGDILRISEGSLAPIACIEDKENQCEHYKECSTVGFWEGLWTVINQYVDSYTLADLVQKED